MGWCLLIKGPPVLFFFFLMFLTVPLACNGAQVPAEPQPQAAYLHFAAAKLPWSPEGWAERSCPSPASPCPTRLQPRPWKPRPAHHSPAPLITAPPLTGGPQEANPPVKPGRSSGYAPCRPQHPQPLFKESHSNLWPPARPVIVTTLVDLDLGVSTALGSGRRLAEGTQTGGRCPQNTLRLQLLENSGSRPRRQEPSVFRTLCGERLLE